MSTAFVEDVQSTQGFVSEAMPQWPRLVPTSESEVQLDEPSDLDVLAKRATQAARQSEGAAARAVNLGLLLSRVNGMSLDEVALMLHVKPDRLRARLHSPEALPETLGKRTEAILGILRQLHQVVDPRGTARWFRLSMPELDGRTPLDELAKGRNYDRVEALVQSYLDPSYV